MEISNLNYFVERIVDLSSMNQVLCEQRREFEDKIEKLEKRIEELESLETFHTEEDEERCQDCGSNAIDGCACGIH